MSRKPPGKEKFEAPPISGSESEEKYRALFEYSPDGILIADIDTKGFLYANPAICEMLGYDTEELIGMAVSDIHPKDKLRRVIADFEIQASGRRTLALDIPCLRKDGTILYADVNTAKILLTGKECLVGFFRDITERKKLEQSLIESEHWYRHLFDNALFGIGFSSIDGKVLNLNKTMETMTGYSVEDYGKINLADTYVNKADREVMLQEIRRHGGVTDYPVELKRKDGTHYHALLTIRLITIGDKEFVQTICHDVTERKQMEEELIKSENKYRSLVETGGAGVVSGDLQGHLTFVNETFCQMLGYSPLEMVGKPFVNFVNPDDRAWVWDRFLTGVAHPELEHHVEFRALHKKGNTLWLSSNPTPVFYKGELVGGNAIIHDITNRKLAEEALRESEEKYRLLAENASDIIWTTDMNLKFTYVSQSVERIRGFTVEEAKGQSLEELLTPASAEMALKVFTEELATEGLETKDLARVRTVELELICKDSSTVWVEVGTSFLRDSVGQPVGILGVAREITERRKAEEALRQSEERYRTILEDMEESYYETDLAGNFTFVNDALCRHLGYSKEEMIGMNYLVYTPPDDVKRVSATSNQVYRTGEPVEWFPREMIRKDGSRTFNETSIFPLRNERGEIIGWRGVGRDVTERKKAEEILRESEDRYRDLVDHSNDLICTHDLDGRILSANPLALRVLGYGLDAMLQKNVRDFLLPEFREGFDAYLTEIQKQGAVKGLLTVQTAKGERRIWEFNNTLRVEGVAAPVVRGMARDITERKQAEEALRRSEERYRTILEDMEDSYFEVDLAGNLTFVNDATCRNLGYSKEELMGMDYRKFTADEDIEPVYQIFNGVFQTGQPHKGYYWNFIRKDGSVGFADASVSALRDREGKIIGFRGVGRDMTDRKKAEQQLLTSAKLASVGELAAGVAHEINNPLTGVLGYAQLLASRQDIPQDIKHDLDVICQESQRTVKIVQNLLRFARQHKPDRTLTDINELIERTLELQLYKLTTSNIKLTTRLAEGCLWVVVDYNQIQQVILNIVINAMQALAEVKHKGKITVTTGIDKGQVIISVADNGPGIDKENIAKVFDPFFSTKAVGSGSGLGLSVCHGIIAEHDGNIYVESTKGEGATFIIELPSAPENAAVVKEKIVIEKKRPRRRRKVEKSILIVEDEPVICDVLVRVLSEDGYQVDIASSGKEALRKLKKKVHDLFIVDLKMPEMSGRQLYKIMKDKHPKAADRVVFITGDTVTPETQSFLTSTGRPYLRKPFDYKELIKMVEEILREALSR